MGLMNLLKELVPAMGIFNLNVVLFKHRVKWTCSI